MESGFNSENSTQEDECSSLNQSTSLTSFAPLSSGQARNQVPNSLTALDESSSIRMFVDSQDDSMTDDDSTEIQSKDKVNKGTLTEGDGGKPLECKYCIQRLSKLRKIEKLNSAKIGVALGTERLQSPDSKTAKKDVGCQTSASLFEQAEMNQQELRSLATVLGYRDGKSLRSETFCQCVKHGKGRDCKCGEDETYLDWVWDVKNRGPVTTLLEEGCLVMFHKKYSCGTTAVRGEQAMDKDQYFWEIKLTTPVYGTDMMIGVGTPNVDLSRYQKTFCSMLGCDMDSWGISYDGRIHHAGTKMDYCDRFGQGAIIGVHLDMWHGTLAFFKNRRSLGIAFRGLRGRTLYPMACSTAARSGMRVISSRSFPTSLQFLCCQKLRKLVPAHQSVLDALSMPPGLRVFLSNNMTWLLHVPYVSKSKSKASYICNICTPLKTLLEGRSDDEEGSSDEGGTDHVHRVPSVNDSSSESEEENSIFYHRSLNVSNSMPAVRTYNQSDTSSLSSSSGSTTSSGPSRRAAETLGDIQSDDMAKKTRLQSAECEDHTDDFHNGTEIHRHSADCTVSKAKKARLDAGTKLVKQFEDGQKEEEEEGQEESEASGTESSNSSDEQAVNPYYKLGKRKRNMD